MGCLIVSGIKFYVLKEGEPYPDPHAGKQYVGAYAVFPFEGKWVAQKYFREGAGVISRNADLTLKARHSTSHTNMRFSRKTVSNINPHNSKQRLI